MPGQDPTGSEQGEQSRTYCTILSSNYLPRALALAESLRRHEEGAILELLFIDIPSDDALPELEGVRCLSTATLGLSEREVLELAMSYDLVELATAVKPLLLKKLLGVSGEVVYLDPDTFVTSAMAELGPALSSSSGGILLTPHFLRPTTDNAETTEGHMLYAGVYNLGFCAVDRRAFAFLDWWWEHLRYECLLDIMAGIFYDQKWMDIGSELFHAGSLRHYGYNVGLANLGERPLAADEEGYYVASTGDRLRLFHFHAFDSSAPEKISMRSGVPEDARRREDAALQQLCKEYAVVLGSFEVSVPPAPPYPYSTDTRGRRIPRVLRRAYRQDARAGVDPLPSPFVDSESGAYDRWRRRARKSVARDLLGDAAKFLRIALPEEYARVKSRFPGLAHRLNDRFSRGSGLWGHAGSPSRRW